MNAWVWFPAAALFVAIVFAATNDAARRWSDRRWARIVRENDRRALRYETWKRVSQIGGDR